MNIKQYIIDIHQHVRDKGFWNVERPRNEVLLLILSELCEGLEALRHAKRWDNIEISDEDNFVDKFIEIQKDTFEDELADTVIRIFDYIGSSDSLISTFLFDITTNIGHICPFGETNLLWDCCKAITLCSDINNDIDLSLSLANTFSDIQIYCSQNNINLKLAIDQKMKYNKTRPYKHQKQF